MLSHPRLRVLKNATRLPTLAFVIPLVKSRLQVVTSVSTSHKGKQYAGVHTPCIATFGALGRKFTQQIRALLKSEGAKFLLCLREYLKRFGLDYVVVDVTDVIHADRRAKVEFASETVRIGVHVYKRSESMLCMFTHT